jgi:pyridoxamine 5'-phosphate oxidase
MSIRKVIADIRKDYKLKTLDESDVAPNPITQFSNWWEEAVHSEIDEVNAMTLATINEQGHPAARIVLLKSFDENGFLFFTNYNSDKGKQLAAHNHAALVFFWKELERQVRIEGIVAKTSEADSDAYFHSRPLGSQIGAWASEQSSVIPAREVLEANVEKYTAQFGNAVQRPPHWGGYCVKPVKVEFWQGRSSRLHDRIVYTLQPGNSWKIERLAP